MRKVHERHLLRLERIGIDLKSRHSLRNRLKQIKQIVNPELAKAKLAKVSVLENALDEQENERLDMQLDRLNKTLRAKQAKQTNPYEQLYREWHAKSMPIKEIQRQQAIKKQFHGLITSDREKYFRLLLENAGQIT